MKRKTFHIIATSVCMLIYAGLTLYADEQPWLIWPALAFALLSIIFACLWMVSLDEAAQQAHYISWFWGGSAGLLISMLAFVTIVLRPDAFAAILDRVTAPYAFAGGIAFGVTAPVIGYLVWWVILWLRRL